MQNLGAEKIYEWPPERVVELRSKVIVCMLEQGLIDVDELGLPEELAIEVKEAMQKEELDE